MEALAVMVISIFAVGVSSDIFAAFCGRFWVRRTSRPPAWIEPMFERFARWFKVLEEKD